jgi:hypothetical protein
MSNGNEGAVVQVGTGVSDATGDTYMVHNPRPSTARGQRRHEKRNEAQKAHANLVYERPAPKTFHDGTKCSHASCKSSRKGNDR